MNAKSLNKSEQNKFDNLAKKSSRIRYLSSLGWSRGEISKFLGIRYQHVRNVLITPVTNPSEKF